MLRCANMVDYGQLAIGIVAVAVGLWFGYKVALAARQYAALSGTEPSASSGVADGEATTIEGQVVVDEPAEEAGTEQASGRALAEPENPLALLVWRIRRVRGNVRFSVGSSGRRRSDTTLATGIEPGAFRVETGSNDVRVDPEWLLANHSTDETGSLGAPDPWSSPYIHLKNHTEDVAVEGGSGLPGSLDLGTGSIQFGDSERFQSKAIPEGERVVVHGETRVEGGETVIGGSDDTALVVSDQPIEGLVSGLRYQALKSAAIGTAFLAAGVYFVYDAVPSL